MYQHASVPSQLISLYYYFWNNTGNFKGTGCIFKMDFQDRLSDFTVCHIAALTKYNWKDKINERNLRISLFDGMENDVSMCHQ